MPKTLPWILALTLAWGATTPAQAATGSIDRWLTAGKQHLSHPARLAWHTGRGPAGAVITLHPEKRAQSVLGFGGAFTDASCYMFNQLDPAPRKKLLEQLYGKSGLGLSVGRVPLGSSDYATHVYSYDDDGPDPEMKHFTLAHDKEYILPVLRLARQVNPDLYLFGSPWSPPGWMKPNKSMLGGCMTRTYFGAYALYFQKFLEGYKAEGVPVQAVTIQNETDTEQQGKMPACAWPQEYEMAFASENLGPTLRKAHLDTQIWLIDHNYSLWGRALDELEDPGVRQAASAIAWHGYVGDPKTMMRVHNAYPKTEMHWTEGGPDITDPAYTTNWTHWSGTFTGILRNWCRSITAWNLALDEKGQPNVGPFPCGGVVTIDRHSKAITYSGQYWALAHFAKFIPRGSVIIGSEGQAGGVQHVAARRPDGKTTVVLTNEAKSAKSVTLRLGRRWTRVDLPADSVETLVF